MATRYARRPNNAPYTLGDALRSIYAAAALTAVALWLILSWKPELGSLVSSIIVSFFVLDFVAAHLLHGGNGFAKSRLLDAIDGRNGTARPKGHAFLLHLATILVSAWAVPPVTDKLLTWSAAEIGDVWTRFLLAAVLTSAVAYSTHVRYFRRP